MPSALVKQMMEKISGNRKTLRMEHTKAAACKPAPPSRSQTCQREINS